MAASTITDFGYAYARGVTGIDAKVVGNTALLISEPDSSVRHFVVLANIGGQTLAGVTSGPTVSLGTNSPNFDNIMAATVVPASLTGSVFVQPLNTNPLVQNGAVVNLRVSVAANATAYIIRAHLLLVSFGLIGF
jgi:hypothetical protein